MAKIVVVKLTSHEEVVGVQSFSLKGLVNKSIKLLRPVGFHFLNVSGATGFYPWNRMAADDEVWIPKDKILATYEPNEDYAHLYATVAKYSYDQFQEDMGELFVDMATKIRKESSGAKDSSDDEPSIDPDTAAQILSNWEPGQRSN